MTRRTSLLLLLALTVLAAPAAADIIPAGHHSVRHVLVLEDDPRLADVTLVLAPVRGFGGTEVLAPGTEQTFSGKYGTRVYALRPGEPVPETPDDLKTKAFASGAIPVGHTSFVSNSNPTQEMISTIRFDGIEGTDVKLDHVATQRFGVDGGEVDGPWTMVVMIAVGALGLLLVVLLLRRRRAAADAA